MQKCLDKKRLIKRIACLNCPHRFKDCKMSQELIDSNIFLRVYLQEDGWDKYESLINKNEKLYIGFLTTIQASHILRRINEKIVEIENSKDRNKSDKISKLESNRDRFSEKLKEFHIIDFDDASIKIFNQLNEIDSLRMESHDKMNISVAISNKLDLQAIDNNLIEDFSTIENFSKGFGYTIILNKEF